MTLHQFVLIVRARARVTLAVALGSVMLALLVSLLMRPTYSAQTSLLVDVRTPDPVTGAAGLQGLVAPSYMATQVDIIAGDRVAQRVVRMLKLDQDPELQQDWQQATQGRGSLEGWIASELQRGLDVHPARESNVINIVYKGRDAEQVAQVANAFAQAYLDTNLALKTEPARVYAQWFDDQARDLRARLEEAQARLSDYQQKAGLVSGDERLDHESTRLAELSAQLTQVQGLNTEVQGKRAARGDTVAEVMQSSVVNGLQADISRQEARLREASVNLGPNHPQLVRMQSELAGLRAQLQAEVGRVHTSIDTAWRVGQQRERELQAALAAQKARVMTLNKQRDELNVYRRDVEAAQRAYEEVSKNANQSRLQSLTNQTNVVRLDAAVPPLEPASPRLKLNVLVATFAGTLLGIGLALLLELMHRRVRSAEDIAQALDVPVLARLSAGDAPGQGGPDLLSGPPPLALGHGR